MAMLRFGLVVSLWACGPTAAEVRLRSVDRARVDAVQRPGARQLQGLADAIHTAYAWLEGTVSSTGAGFLQATPTTTQIANRMELMASG